VIAMTTLVDPRIDRWLPLRGPVGSADGMPMYCLPHAGAGASAYRPWLGRLSGVSVRAVQPPGREGRFRDPVFTGMSELVGELAEVVIADLERSGAERYAVYGHSLGALVAFELVRALRTRGAPDPAHLFVSGCVAPQYGASDGPSVLGMSRAEVVDMLRRLGGTPEWLLADASVVDMILPAVRADFSVKETYAHRPAEPLAVPLTVIASTADPRADLALQHAWREHTTGAFELHTLVGGHFAVFEQEFRTHRFIADALSTLERS
jgi:surfactin synthase thioesterase subunit